jgi:ATP-dependent exoDNAse (exonuclease V) beta subunit
VATTKNNSSLAIELISAGAGSGKTYTLTQRLVELLKGGVKARHIIATTFTQKAAAELQERVRIGLLEAGMTEAANELGDALIGTVHSIGVRLLQRFAFEVGMSPLVEIIADGDEQRLFNESLAQVLTDERIEEMNLLSDRLGFTKRNLGAAPYDWRRLIREVTNIARINNFSEEVLQRSKAYSIQSFFELLPHVSSRQGLQWQNQLIAQIEQTIEALENNEQDETKTTRDSIEALRQAINQYKWRGGLYWFEYVKLSKLKVAVKSKDLFEPLRETLMEHDQLEAFHQDNRRLIELVFDITIDALREFEQYKTKRGLIDYTDMETGVSKLLRSPSVRHTLAQELDLLMVDEFQDTSPIQLDIFIQLSMLAKKSIWVGDPKQSIYGFRGAEPALMQAVIDSSGGIQPENILKNSWRSRPDLVHLSNAIFTKAFSDTPREQVVLEPVCKEAPEEKHPTAFRHWHFQSEEDERRPPGQPWMDLCIANSIRKLIEEELPVWNKKRTKTRQIQPGDIGILCKTNKDCQRISEALHQAGIKAAMARPGLLETPEIRLITACLKYVLTPSDKLSLAEISLISGDIRLEEFVQRQMNPDATPDLGIELGRQIRERRTSLIELSPSEILNQFLSQLDLRNIVAGLGAATQRLDNIEQIRKLALEYESACQRLHTAASLSGFLLWLSSQAENELDLQGSGEDEDTVRVMTYHKSKGLEFPLTICHNMDARLRENIWGVNLISETDKPDLNHILDNRLIRLWSNPYSDQLRNTRLEEALHQTDAWATSVEQARNEEARLLYVGLTRARDYLIIPSTKLGTPWLNRVFSGDAAAATLEPDQGDHPFFYNNKPLPCQQEVMYFPKNFEAFPLDEKPFRVEETNANPGQQQTPLLLDVFRNSASGPQTMDKTLYGPEYSDETGLPVLLKILPVFHALPDPEKQIQFQCDLESIPVETVRQGILDHARLVQNYVKQEIPNGTSLAHVPFVVEQNGQLAETRADMLCESNDRIAAFLFKEKIDATTLHYASWLLAALQIHQPNKMCGVYLVCPASGTATKLAP